MATMGDQPGFKLVVRKLSQEDVDQLNEAGINGYSEGMEGYFYETLSTKSTPSGSTVTPSVAVREGRRLFKTLDVDDIYTSEVSDQFKAMVAVPNSSSFLQFNNGKYNLIPVEAGKFGDPVIIENPKALFKRFK